MSAQQPSTSLLISYVQTKLIVRQLQTVLKAAGLPCSGVKKSLQDRLVHRIQELTRSNDTEALEKLRSIIYNPDAIMAGPSTSLSVGRPNGYSSSPTNGDHHPYYASHSYPNSAGGNRIHFKPSPFYNILESLCAQHIIPIMTENRNTVVASVCLTQSQLNTLNGKNARAMLYCGPLDPASQSHLGKVEIGFPTPVEVKVNGQPIPANQLRGLKNKPGSTRPPDITQFLTKAVGYKNDVSITYALTNKKYAFIINLVNVVPIEKLVQDLRQSNNKISKQTVIDDMIKRNEDSDLVATSSVMSLKCPLSTLRIETPVRSKICTHVQCFDAASFLQLQQQAPTWSCPSCSKPVPYELLVVDSYVQDILDQTPKSVDSVTVDPNGVWTVASQRSPSADMTPYSDDDDEDVVEIHDSRPVRKLTSQPAPSPRPGSIMRDDISRSASKRPISQVIDLTLSDDEQPPRPTKRPTTNQLHTPSSMSSSSADGGNRSLHRNAVSFPLSAMNSRTHTHSNGSTELPHR